MFQKFVIIMRLKYIHQVNTFFSILYAHIQQMYCFQTYAISISKLPLSILLKYHSIRNNKNCNDLTILYFFKIIVIISKESLQTNFSITHSNSFFLFFFKFYFIFKLYIIVLVLPNIKMNPQQVYMCSPS